MTSLQDFVWGILQDPFKVFVTILFSTFIGKASINNKLIKVDAMVQRHDPADPRQDTSAG